MPIELKNVKFGDIRKKYAGVILIMTYGDKCVAFTPLVMDIASEVKCDCGHSGYNATNFTNPIHFCPNKSFDFTVTDYKAI